MNKNCVNVIHQITRETNKLFVTKTIGISECCGEMVTQSQYGADEECPKCKKNLIW